MTRCTCRPRDTCEACFMQQVADLARLRGWWVFHVYDSRRSREGWPDLVLLRGRRALFRELKRDGGRLSDLQRDVLKRLADAGLNAGVWYPADWPAIEEELA